MVREALARDGVPGSRVDLYGTTRGEVLLSDYDGEARLIQEPEFDEIAAHELVFLCEAGELAGRLSESRPGGVVIDVVGVLPESLRPRLVHVDLNPQAAQGHDGFLAVPHPLATILCELLFPLERGLGLDEVVAVVLRPAADFGEQGIEELREQTVKLLNFAKLPVETFGRQLAFNIIPQARLDCGSPRSEAIVAGQVAELLGWERNRLALKLLAAPLFYGHGLEMRLRFRNGATLDGVRSALEQSGFSDNGDAAATTPLDVADEKATRLAELSEDDMGGFWLWAVAGGSGRRAAEQAVRLAGSVSDL
jgi:aspartate-semialdehyde dehydrogenase